MKKYVIAGFAFCLVIGFQNCSPRKLSDANGTNSFVNPTEVTPVEKVDVSLTKVLEVPESAYLESKLQSVITQLNPTSTFSSHHLEIDVSTGIIHVLNQNNEMISGIQYCLTSADLVELHAILDTAKICEEKAAVEGQMCTADYTFPYARLHFANAEVSLGESLSGCHKGPDLCGEQKDMLQGFLANIQNNLESKKCEFQVVKQDSL